MTENPDLDYFRFSDKYVVNAVNQSILLIQVKIFKATVHESKLNGILQSLHVGIIYCCSYLFFNVSNNTC